MHAARAARRRDAAAAREAAAAIAASLQLRLMPNALAHETSPYLLQHRDNPVDWLPWGDEALRRAREQDRPLLVSIGYSSCHWCHVMERESFEDPETAALMNERFVCVKVDREERPDVDALYMDAVQAMTGHGGWPLNVFLTPEQAPFYGGTYFPPEPRQGMPSWRQVLGAVADAWDTQREEIRAQGEQVAPRLAGGALLAPSEQPLDGAALDDAVAEPAHELRQRPRRLGRRAEVPAGVGRSSSCSRATSSRWRCRRCARWPAAASSTRSAAASRATASTRAGPCRTSRRCSTTTRCWRAPTCTASRPAAMRCCGAPPRRRSTGRCARCAPPRAASTARSTPTPRASRASSTSGALDELRAALGDDADAAIAWFGATERGNFEGANILESRGPEPPPEQRERIRATLLAVRAQRVRPGLDDKRLAAGTR